MVGSGGGATIAEERDRAEIEAKAKAAEHPLVKSALAAFPGAKLTSVRSAEEIAASAAVEALPEVDDEWDPFEED